VLLKLNPRKQEEEGAEGSSGTNWRDSLPEEIKDSPDLAGFESVEALASNFVERGRYLNDSIRIPSEDAGEEALRAFEAKLLERVPTLMPTPDFTSQESVRDLHKRMGMPSDAGAYKNPEGLEAENDQVMMELSHELGLTQSQYEGIMKGVMKNATLVQEANENVQFNNLLELKKDWGLSYDDKTSQVSALLEIMEAPEYLKASFKDNSMPTETVRWLNSLAHSIGAEGNEILDPTIEAKPSPYEAQVRIDEIMSNRDHPYWDAKSPAHEAAQREMLQLTEASIG